jgi:hypothetical protein
MENEAKYIDNGQEDMSVFWKVSLSISIVHTIPRVYLGSWGISGIFSTCFGGVVKAQGLVLNQIYKLDYVKCFIWNLWTLWFFVVCKLLSYFLPVISSPIY